MPAPARPALARWVLPAVWVTLPVSVGPALADALDGRDRPVQVVAAIGLWAGWAVVLGAGLVPSTVSLTLTRVGAPAGVAVVVAAAIAGPRGGDDTVALGAALIAAVVALAPPVADAQVDGSSYGDERRFLLRTPTAVLLGPVELAWLAVALGLTTGPFLLAAGSWLPGAAALVVGLPAAWLGGRSLHQLSRRWLVFVPAGLVVHDPLLGETLMLPRRLVVGIAPAEVGTTATDLTLGALGLALEIRLSAPVAVSPSAAARLDAVETEAALISPSRPGHVLAEATRRRLPVGPEGEPDRDRPDRDRPDGDRPDGVERRP